MPESFHFIQPLWLLALIPLALLVWSLGRHTQSNNPWRKIIDARLLPLLMSDTAGSQPRLPLWLLGVGGLLAVLALANPSWEQLPQPLMQTSTARVIVLDLSRSMLAADLQPSRLVRARFKIEDILAADDEGQTGLVVFAGDAFSVTPLTRDADTLRAQLKALEPAIMPAQGSRADLGLLKAEALLQQAGVDSGQVLLIADGFEGDLAVRAAAQLRQSGYRVSVLGVGTALGALLTDGRTGDTRLVKLDSAALQAVAEAGGGHYSPLTGNASDLGYLLDTATSATKGQRNEEALAVRWKEQGPLLAVLLLPLAALAFRRGWLLGVLLCAALITQPEPAMAFGWDDLWLRPDQQAAQKLHQGDYAQAATLAKDPALRGSAEYKKGDYREALDAFAQVPGADGAYNRGNALAKQGDYAQAIAAYDEALKTQPGMEDAAANKAAVEALLKQQEQQQQQNPQENQPGNSDDPSGQPGNNDDASGQPGQPGQSADGKDASSDGDDAQAAPQQAGHDSKDGVENEPGAAESQAADGADKDKPDDGADNAFANANEQLDKEQGKQQADGEFDSAAPPTENRNVNQAGGNGNEQASDSGRAPAEAEALTSEEQLAAQQWLRRIPDDPGGLLRRKFLYQYRERGQPSASGQDW